MSGGEGGDKTEKPTPKRLKKARSEGQFPRTPDAAIWAGIGAGFAMLGTTVGRVTDRFEAFTTEWAGVAADPSPAVALHTLGEVPGAVLGSVWPLAAAATLAGLAVTAAQGVHPSGKAIKPTFKRMNPLQGVKRMFGMHAVWEAAKALAKVIVIGGVAYALGKGTVPQMLAGTLTLRGVLDAARHSLTTTVWAAVVAGVVLAVADYSYQRRQVMKKLRMSLRDIKDEHKQSEGDPQVKSAIRSRQLAMSRNRMLKAVSEADVVLVNPTHYAVALSYKRGRGAPRVIAKGAGALALKIRERAREARVPVVEDKPLCRALYRICEVGEEIPGELYLAVAKILAFVMAAGKPSPTASASRSSRTAALPDLPTRVEVNRRRVTLKRQSRGARPRAAAPRAGTRGS
ncbi:MAG: EscU/YscU/HrcU family type III secretion system export apparatus switch protein [Kineosporiaceae bacterium]